MDSSSIGRTLIVVGLVIVGVGALFVVGASLGIGKLPGDIDIRRGNSRFVFPIVSCLLISLVGSLLLNLFRR